MTANIPEATVTHELMLECGRCQETVKYDIPQFMLGAVTILFHASHEGHALRFSYMGHEVKSPRFDEAVEKRDKVAPKRPPKLDRMV